MSRRSSWPRGGPAARRRRSPPALALWPTASGRPNTDSPTPTDRASGVTNSSSIRAIGDPSRRTSRRAHPYPHHRVGPDTGDQNGLRVSHQPGEMVLQRLRSGLGGYPALSTPVFQGLATGLPGQSGHGSDLVGADWSGRTVLWPLTHCSTRLWVGRVGAGSRRRGGVTQSHSTEQAGRFQAAASPSCQLL